MGFSDKMRDSLGAEGATLRAEPPPERLTAGSLATTKIVVVGGTRPVQVDHLTLRIVQAKRRWIRDDGTSISEHEAQGLVDRAGLTAAWDRATLSEQKVRIGEALSAGERHEMSVELAIPDNCESTAPGCTHTLNVQASVKGQIDPATNAKLTLASA